MSKTLYILYIQEPSDECSIPIPIPDITPLNPPLGLRPPIPHQVKFIADKDAEADRASTRPSRRR